jgi:hypothetical protein
MKAPVVITPYDLKFYEQLPKRFPQSTGLSAKSFAILGRRPLQHVVEIPQRVIRDRPRLPFRVCARVAEERIQRPFVNRVPHTLSSPAGLRLHGLHEALHGDRQYSEARSNTR